jgi:EAL domain-containing protein (putative c-di-GMP-specific phosphodiesterase class I)/ActR/RegA family two-component response regulator
MVDDGLKAGRALVVDDDASLRSAYVRILAAAGLAVDACESAEEVVERLRNGERYQVIVTDLVMPGTDGIALLQLVRQFDVEVPVIILTGRPSMDSTIAAIEHQVFKYLLKPVTPLALRTAVLAAVATCRLAVLKRRALEVCADQGWRTDAGSLEEQFESALRQLFMLYQPIVTSGGEVFGFEALVRTSEPTFRSPEQLFSAAERLGRVQELGRMIRKLVALEMESGPPASVLFVNLHASDLADAELYSANAALSRNAARTVLEITERKSLDGIPDIRSRLSDLRKLGYRIAVDDLGAGYSGLSCFNTLEPELVKLDMSLIRDVDSVPRKRALVESMIQVCSRDLGIQVVCEGVETQAECDVLLNAGAPLLQGYLFGRPQRGLDISGAAPLHSELRLRAQRR